MRNTSGHIVYSAEINRRKTERQTRKRETKTNMGQLYKRLDWLETIKRYIKDSGQERLPFSGKEAFVKV